MANGWPQQTKSYIEELQAEMRRVTWPSWQQVRATTGVVIATVFILAAYFWVVNAVVNSVITWIIDQFTR